MSTVLFWKRFAVLAAATLSALLITTPAILTVTDPTQPPPFSIAPMSPWTFTAIFVVGNLVVSLLVIGVGLRLGDTIGLGTPLLRAWLEGDARLVKSARGTFGASALWGVALGIGILLCGLVGRSHLPSLPEGFRLPPVWQGSLLILGAALREEVLFRLGAMNLLVWLGVKLTKRQPPTLLVIWIANIMVSVGFAVAHVVPVMDILELNAIASTLLPSLAAAAGIVFGYIFWRHGLIAAVVTHAVAGTIVYAGVRVAMFLNP